MDAMEALRNDDVDLAIATMSKARAQTEKDRNAPVGSERATLLALVQARVDAAEAKRNLATSSKREQSFAAIKTMEGDKIVSQVSGAIVRNEFADAHEMLQKARQCFADAGGSVERDREYVLGNLFASLRAEEERVAGGGGGEREEQHNCAYERMSKSRGFSSSSDLRARTFTSPKSPCGSTAARAASASAAAAIRATS